jgi:chaperonin GroES
MIKPIGDNILILPCEPKQEVVGGIILPDSAKQVPVDAKVIALGTGGLDDNGNKIVFSVKKGDKVITSTFAGEEITLGDQTYKIVKNKDILAIIEE